MSIATMPLEQHPYSGLVCDTEVPKPDRHCALAIHIAPLTTVVGLFPIALLLPLIVWILRKDESEFVDDHGRECLNFMISLILWHIVLAITVIGIPLIFVLWIVAVVSFIRAAVAGSRGEYFRYPITFRML